MYYLLILLSVIMFGGGFALKDVYRNTYVFTHGFLLSPFLITV